MFCTIIILKEEAENMYDVSAIVIAFLINALLLYVIFKNSIYIKQYLGITGQNVITKLMGLMVAAIAVQFIVSGVIALSVLYLK